MRKLIPAFGDECLIGRGDPFGTLARSIVGQQISVKAADAVWLRFMQTCGTCTPKPVLDAGKEGLAACGLSRRKVEYLLDLATHFQQGRVHASHWAEMPDEDVIADLDADSWYRALDSRNVLDF